MDNDKIKLWLEASDKLIEFVSGRIGNDISKGSEEEIIIDVFFRKGFKHYRAIVLLCKNEFGQDALCLTRVLIELYFYMKYIVRPARNEDIKKRAVQFAIADYSESIKFIRKWEKEDPNYKAPKEKKEYLEQTMEKYDKPDEWGKRCIEIADKVQEMKAYRSRYAFFQVLFTHLQCFQKCIMTKTKTISIFQPESYGCIRPLVHQQCTF